MTQSHTTNEVTYESNAIPPKKITRKIDTGMLSLSEVTTSITKLSQHVCVCTLYHDPAQTHLFQQLKTVKWTGLKQLKKGMHFPLFSTIVMVTAKQNGSSLLGGTATVVVPKHIRS